MAYLAATSHKSGIRRLHGLGTVHRAGRTIRMRGLGIIPPPVIPRYLFPVTPCVGNECAPPAPVVTAAPAAIPGGSYQLSCQNMAVVNGQLQAQCKRIDGTLVPATGDLVNCPGGTFTNVNGVLVCDATGVPSTATTSPTGQTVVNPYTAPAAPIGIDPATGIPYAQEYGSSMYVTQPYANPMLPAPYVAAPSAAPVQTSASGGKIPTWGYVAIGVGGLALFGMLFKR